MVVTVEIPDEVASLLAPAGEDTARKLLEEHVAQAYREGRLTTMQLRQALGFESWYEVDPFLLKYKVFDYTLEDYEADAEAYSKATQRA